MSNINTMIDRTGEVLDYLYKADKAVGVSKLSADLDLPKATVFRILTTLEKWGLVDKAPQTDKYRLGLVLIKYGAKVAAGLSMVSLAKPVINNFSEDIGESISLSIEHAGYALNLYKSSTGNSILASRLIPISALNCSASGKLFLSTKSDAALADFFSSERCVKRTENAIVDYNTFLTEREAILTRHIAYDNEEYEYGLYCIAAPVHHRGNTVAAVSISGPKSRLALKGMTDLEGKIKLAAKTISDLIDYLEPDNLL